MNDDLDHILAGEPEVQPSSRFARNVMAAVRREAAIPPPIEFPWRRALPAIVTAGVVLAGLVVSVAVAPDAAPSPSADGRGRPWLGFLAWSWVGCLVTWVVVRASTTLSERRYRR